MNISLQIFGCTRSQELYRRLREYDANVIDSGDSVFIFASCLTKQEYDEVIAICEQYGKVEV